VAINLASRLNAQGKRTGLVDADVDSANVAEMLKIQADISVPSVDRLEPVRLNNGVEVFSMAWIAKDRPVSMEETEYVEILRDVVRFCNWGVDYFVVDMPAGSSDIWKGLVSVFEDSLLGSIVVMLPTSVEDARRIIKLHQLNGVPILGLIENMSHFRCEHGDVYKIYGEPAGESLAKEFGLPFFGGIPLSMEIRRGVDEGKPVIEGEMAQPIDSAAKVVLSTAPRAPGFLSKVKDAVKGIARSVLEDIMVEVVGIANLDIDIDAIQRQHGFTGGNVIEFNLTDETLKKVKVQDYFKIEGGRLLGVENPKRVDVEIYIWDRALIWSLLGEKPVDGGVKYDLMDAWLNGEAKFYCASGGGTPKAVRFMRDVWSGIRAKATETRLFGVLRRLA